MDRLSREKIVSITKYEEVHGFNRFCWSKIFICLFALFFVTVLVANAKPRLIVLTDIGGDPDDQQSMIRLMTYTNEFDIEALIATASGTPGELGVNVTKPHLIREIIKAYGQVRKNLSLHADGYPAALELMNCVKSGNPDRGVDEIGKGKDTEGSNWIIDRVDRDDSRLVNITIWGGSTDLAQALWRVRNDRSEVELHRFLSKIRVHAISHQDNTGPWIIEKFPQLFYILNKQPEGKDKRESAFRGLYLGGDQSLTSREWMNTHIRNHHGPLGSLYPPKTWTAPNPHSSIKEGDTPSWFYFIPNGLSNPKYPEWGSWGGRFQNVTGGLYQDAQDTVNGITSARATVWRWRKAFQNAFQARMDWCVKSRDEANHFPTAIVNGYENDDIIFIETESNEILELNAADSHDPDGDTLLFHWFVYSEVGSYKGETILEKENTSRVQLILPKVDEPKTIHLILEVTDSGSPPLTSYRRIVIQVNP